MSDARSDAEKIRAKRIAKLGGGNISSSNDIGTASSSGQSAPIPLSSSEPTSNSTPVKSGENGSTCSTSSQGNGGSLLCSAKLAPQNSHITSTPFKRPVISITPLSSSKLKSTPAQLTKPVNVNIVRTTETIERWEDHTIMRIFRFSISKDIPSDLTDISNSIVHLPGLAAEASSWEPPHNRLSIKCLDLAILEVVKSAHQNDPLSYLLACWKRVCTAYRNLRSGTNEDRKQEILREIRRVCFNYCIHSLTSDVFDTNIDGATEMADHFLENPDSDSGIDVEFLREVVMYTQEDDSIKTVIVEAVEMLSAKLAKMSMEDDYKAYITALSNIVQFPVLVDSLTKSERFIPNCERTADFEKMSLLGPFFRLSPIQIDVVTRFFDRDSHQNTIYVYSQQKSLRFSLQSLQDNLFTIANRIVKSGKEPRNKLLDWFATVINTNHKRRAMRPRVEEISSDGFMINVTVILDRLCEPFMDLAFSKVDRIDADYLRRNPHVDISDETKINIDQKQAEEFYGHKAEGTSNFISELFFLTVAAHHYGVEATHSKMTNLIQHVKQLEKHINAMEHDREKFARNPAALGIFETALKRYKDEANKAQCIVYGLQGVLTDDTNQTRAVLFMQHLIVWMLRLVAPLEERDTSDNSVKLPLKRDQPMVFRCLPEYFIEVVIDHFKFFMLNMPHILLTNQCEELLTMCIVFLYSSDYIKNPYLKAGFVSILNYGVYPSRARTHGVMGDLVMGTNFSSRYLLHSLLQFFVEAESTGAHTQFFDKFSIRYEIFQIFKAIWISPIFRENLKSESTHNQEMFIRFVNLLLNDATFVLDESLTAFQTINRLQREMNTSNLSVDDANRKQLEEQLIAAQGKAKSYMQLTNETISMLALFTEALADAFTMPEIVQRLADMLDYNLESMVGPKQLELKVNDPEQYQFRPRELLADLMDIYCNLRQRRNFLRAVARDGRCYKPGNFAEARRILVRVGIRSPERINQWDEMCQGVERARNEELLDEETLGEIPDEFLDPIVFTLMQDPVILPTSRVTVDRSTIRSHLLSDPNDPFNRSPLTIDQVIPDCVLKQRILDFLAERRRSAVALARSTPSPPQPVSDR